MVNGQDYLFTSTGQCTRSLRPFRFHLRPTDGGPHMGMYVCMDVSEWQVVREALHAANRVAICDVMYCNGVLLPSRPVLIVALPVPS